MPNPDDFRLVEVSLTRTRQIAVPKTMSKTAADDAATRRLLDDVEYFAFEPDDVTSRELPMRDFDDDMDVIES